MKRSIDTRAYLALFLLTTQVIYTQQSHSREQATVRIGNRLCNQERQYQLERQPKIKDTLEKILGSTLNDNQVPCIAFCASGGGMRSTISTLGTLQGSQIDTAKTRTATFLTPLLGYLPLKELIMYAAQIVAGYLGWAHTQTTTPNNNIVESSQLNLLDACTYCSSLSGSAWAFAGLQHSRMAPQHYLNYVAQQIDTNFLYDVELEDITLKLIEKTKYNQPISLIDIYGCILAQTLLKDLGNSNESAITLESYSSLADTEQSPFPIHCAVLGQNTTDYEWVEFTPYEVNCLNTSIPTWAFGRKFDKGASQDFAPPQSLGYGMGIWGSAMSVSAKEIFNLLVEPKVGSITAGYLQTQFSNIVASGIQQFASIHALIPENSSPLDSRVSPARVFNWTLNIPNVSCNNAPTLTLIDAGVSCNIALPPLLRAERKVDIIIIFDASDNEPGYELYRAQEYAKKRNLKFPQINHATVHNTCSVHRATDTVTPVVIYIPLIKNAHYQNGWDPHTAQFTDMLNFVYTKDQVDLLSGLAVHNMQESLPTIINVIREWIQGR